MQQDLAATLRAAIAASDKTIYALAQLSGVKEQRLRVFAAGGDMQLKNASKLAAALGFRLTRPRSKV